MIYNSKLPNNFQHLSKNKHKLVNDDLIILALRQNFSFILQNFMRKSWELYYESHVEQISGDYNAKEIIEPMHESMHAYAHS